MNTLIPLARGVAERLRARAQNLAVAESSAGGLISASLLAGRLRQRLGADWALAESGASGPTGNRYGDAPGHAVLAVAGPVERVQTLETGRDGREDNMRAFAAAALTLLTQCLDGG